MEDNVINQQVAAELLLNMGLAVTMANNGKEAVDLLRQPNAVDRFDIVLMDLQMPVMDGYTATRKIRELDSQVRNIPIIALTAHAMIEEGEKCRAAGMNDHFSKPIDPHKLAETLGRWIHRKIIPPKKEPVDTMEDLLLAENLAGIDLKTALTRTGGNTTLLRQLMREFQLEFNGCVKQMEHYLKIGDVEEGERLAHTIKGVSGNIGAQQLYEASSQLEQAFRQGSSDNFRSLKALFKETISEVLESCTILATPGKTTSRHIPFSGDADNTRALLCVQSIRRQLEADELIDEALMAELKTILLDRDQESLWLELETKVFHFDYASALAAMDTVNRLLN